MAAHFPLTENTAQSLPPLPAQSLTESSCFHGQAATPSTSCSGSGERLAMKPKTQSIVVVEELGCKPDVEESHGVDAVRAKKGLDFWLVMVAICVSLFLSAVEYSGTATALPTIIHDLDGVDYVWVASAYALAATALLPASGGMAEVFGRRTAMLLSLAIFSIGSALCGSAQSMNWLIAARTIQGAGGGAILSLSSIVLSDLVPLRERAMYNALIGLTWTFAAAIGPLIGGVLAEHGQWRWFFYLNLPLTGVAAVLVICFLKLRTPRGTAREKLARMDWIGNLIITTSSSACVIALTWGGVRFPWDSFHVLVPLILGLCGIAFFLFYEARFATNPLVPYSLISNRTSLSGYVQTFLAPVVLMTVIYYSSTFYQACKGASPIESGIYFFGVSMTIGPCLILTGITVAKFKSYRVQLWIGWGLFIIGMGLMSTLDADSSLSTAIGYSAFMGIGGGSLFSATYFPVLAPLPIYENAHALAFFAFCRSFAGVWGVTIGTAILQTQLSMRLPAEFLAQFPGGVAVAYSAIPVISALPGPVQDNVRQAFAEGISVIWQVMIGISGLGLLSSLFMKGLPLHTDVDEKWGMEQSKEGSSSN